MVAFANYPSMCTQICICKLIRWPAYHSVTERFSVITLDQTGIMPCSVNIVLPQKKLYSALYLSYWEVNHQNYNKITLGYYHAILIANKNEITRASLIEAY